MPPKKSFSEIQSQRKATALPTVQQVNIPPSVPLMTISALSTPVSISADNFSPEQVEAIKEKIKQDKIAEQKQKKRDYQREYMRKYKKDVPPTEEEKLKRKVKRSLGKIDPEKLKPIVAELLGDVSAP
jgi:hypothetical protein